VEGDLRKLQVKNTHLKGNVQVVDVSDLKTASEKPELALRKPAENHLNAINRQMLTIYDDDDDDEEGSKDPPKLFHFSPQFLFNSTSSFLSVQWCVYSSACSVLQQLMEMDLKILLDPENTGNKGGGKQHNWETRLPLITKKKSTPMGGQKIVEVNSLCSWPASPHLDSTLPLLEEDARKGSLSVTEQRLIPPAAKRPLQTPPIGSKTAPFHRQDKRSVVVHSVYSSSKGSVAPLPPSTSMVSARKAKPEYPAQRPESNLQIPSRRQPLWDLCSDSDITVYRGTMDREAPGFLAFKQCCGLSWGRIGSFLEHTEKLLKDCAVPVATINCKKLAEVASDFQPNENPTQSHILSVIKNQSAVARILNRPGQRHKGQGGTEMAATKIHQARKASVVHSRQQQWASGVIATAWLSRHCMARVKKSLEESRRRHLENFYSRAKHLAANWNRIRTSRRTIIHIPSLGYSQCTREHIPDLALQQNMQMGRLCDILDANVDVIYICPLQLSEELLRYYNKLLGLRAAVRSGKPEDMADLQDRFKILTPEAINSFPQHRMCLATRLKYSPKTIKQIRSLIRSRAAYIVGGVPHKDDVAVADMLNVPILGSGPDVAHRYGTKSGSRRIFAGAGVPTPPGEADIYSNEQLIRALSQLIIDNLEVQRWLFKANDEHGGDGTAYCDIVSHLQCCFWLQEERQRHSPSTWSERWAHEPALVKISQELPGLLAQHVQPVNEKRFPTWEKFLQTFLTQGGVIEAFPLSESITNLTVDVLIEPTGEIQIVSSGDQLHADGPLRSSGAAIPQSSVDPAVLRSLCFRIGESCKSKGVLGYFSVDFVAFTHPQTMEQQVWATDLDLCYSDQLALTQLVLYVTDGNLDPCSGHFGVSLGSKTTKRQRVGHKKPSPVSNRWAVASSQLEHSGLSRISYNVFLQLCKARDIGFDLQEKQGTLFLLYEDQKRCRLGMITIGEDLQGVLLTFARHLFIIHQEISAPNMQGETNFKV
ncbi:IQCH protein, partial [Upupa epops]|nr:IQCH protein [Upupa epops]